MWIEAAFHLGALDFHETSFEAAHWFIRARIHSHYHLALISNDAGRKPHSERQLLSHSICIVRLGESDETGSNCVGEGVCVEMKTGSPFGIIVMILLLLCRLFDCSPNNLNGTQHLGPTTDMDAMSVRPPPSRLAYVERH